MKGSAFLHSSPLSSTSFISAWPPDPNSVIDDTRETIWAKQKGLLSSRDEWRRSAACFLAADKISGSLMLRDFLWLVFFFASFMTPSFLSCLRVHRTSHSSLSLRQGGLSPGCPQGRLVAGFWVGGDFTVAPVGPSAVLSHHTHSLAHWQCFPCIHLKSIFSWPFQNCSIDCPERTLHSCTG